MPRCMLTRCADEYQGDKGCSKYKTYDQFVAMIFRQLKKCYTLSDIYTGIRAARLLLLIGALTKALPVTR